MSSSRSPSNSPDDDWSSPGLDLPTSGHSTPVSPDPEHGSVHWKPTKLRSLGTAISGQGSLLSLSAENRGIFTRQTRRLSGSLPLSGFPSSSHPTSFDGTEEAEQSKCDIRGAERKEKWRESTRWRCYIPRLPTASLVHIILSRLSRKTRLRLIQGLALVLCILVFFLTPMHYHWRRARGLGGGQKFVIILASNVGGGVTEWKGAREWAIERDSVRNKRKYVARWGYDLEVVDMSTKKRYAHEWRESWEKVDFMRKAMRKYPRAEWFWWLDLNTFIMEPSFSLQSHIFDKLDAVTYRDINAYNPLKIHHPPTAAYLDGESRSAVGDGRAGSINLILSQDCSGFNLGSFFLRRSVWTDQLLDVWWDPVAYEQKHMAWEHKEQDALEQLYESQAWIRKHIAFLPQRMINSFPEGACSEHGNDTRIHYDRRDRDFLVNMAGCEWGRDCWGEMYNFRELSYYLNRNRWEQFKEDFVAVLWFKITGRKVRL